MSYQQLLSRIRRLIEAAEARLVAMVHGSTSARLKVPAAPMTDQELAQAIREFQAGPGCNHTETALQPLRPQLKRRRVLDGD